MKNLRIIYRSNLLREVEISSELFLEDVSGPTGLPYNIFEKIIKIEKKHGLVYYVIGYAKKCTTEGYESTIVLDGEDLSLVVMKNFWKKG